MLSVSASNRPGFHYQVSLGRAIDFGYDTANADTRTTIIQSYFARQCKTVSLSDAREIKLAPTFLGVEQSRWIYDVKCDE